MLSRCRGVWRRRYMREAARVVLQARDNVPLWVPVSLVHSTATSPSGATSNGSTGVDITRDERWLEVFPPWEERHRTEFGGDPGCRDPGVEGGPACGRPLASPPMSVPSGNGVWLPKATAGPFLTSITDQVLAPRCHHAQLQQRSQTHHCCAMGSGSMLAIVIVNVQMVVTGAAAWCLIRHAP